jgi:predicted O-methyltransferase YrrM
MNIQSPAPSTDPLSIYRYRDGLYAVDLVAAALSADVFSWMAELDSFTAGQVSDHFGWAARPVDVMLTLFAANQWLSREGGLLKLLPVAREHLCEGSPWSLRPYYASLQSRPVARDFAEVLRTDRPAGWSGDQQSADWHKAMEDEGFAGQFTAAMDCRGNFLGPALAERLDLTGRRKLLDIGAGSGVYACAITARHPHMRAVALDQAPVDRIARRCVSGRGFADRVEVVAADMFESLPGDCDVHLFSNVLHDWDAAEVLRLLRVSRASLPPGGLLVIHDAFINADKTGPLHVAEYSCLLMHSTRGKCHSTGEYSELLRQAGFEPGAWRETVVGRGLMTAIAV